MGTDADARRRADVSTPRRLRVLHVIASSGVGGAERVCATTLAGLDPERFESWVATDGHGAMLDEYRRHATAVRTLPLLYPFAPRTAPPTLVALARLMREIRCDVVHAHLWQADVFAGLAGALAGVPVRVSTVHGDYFDFVSPRVGWRARRFLARRSYRAIYTLFDRVIAVADFIAERLVGVRGYAVPRNGIVRIHAGFDFARIAPRVAGDGARGDGDACLAGAARAVSDGRLPGSAPDDARAPGPAPGDGRAAAPGAAAPVIVTVARFNAYKGHRYLVDAMARVLQRFPAATFLLVGSGRTLAATRAQIARLGVGGSVRFVGETPDALDLIAGADLMVLPSLSEGIPLAALEAQALGTPIVASAVGGLPEVIEHGASGFLVPPRDPPALADAIIAALSDPSLRGAFGARGRAIVRERFSAESMVAATARLYTDLATEKRIALGREDR